MNRLLLTTAAIVFSAGTAFAQEDPTKACFVYVGPTGDFGWTYQHDEGRRNIERRAGQ